MGEMLMLRIILLLEAAVLADSIALPTSQRSAAKAKANADRRPPRWRESSVMLPP
jgi:hypothetical protein